MEKKLDEKVKELQAKVDMINGGRNQIQQLEREALILQGEIKMLQELIAEEDQLTKDK